MSDHEEVDPGSPRAPRPEAVELAAKLGPILPILLAVAVGKTKDRRPPGYTASDLVQDTLAVALLKHRESPEILRGKDGEALKPWLFNVMNNILRDKSRRPLMEEIGDTDLPAKHLPSPISGLVIAENLEKVEAARASLSAKDREIIDLRDRDKLSFKEIGLRRGCSESLASRNYRRAYERLVETANKV